MTRSEFVKQSMVVFVAKLYNAGQGIPSRDGQLADYGENQAKKHF
ncbi:hypothetical protein G9P44_000758 [Scheffersomyces stipitis]|nr:hypothetical protein G9P44_000758 [Scheffersomyces stipitis]